MKADIASPADSRTTPLTVSVSVAVLRSIASADCSIDCTSPRSFSPAEVSTKRSDSRSNSRAPLRCSSAFTRRATVGWLTPSDLAAVVSVPSRARVRKIRRSSQLEFMNKTVQALFRFVD